MTTVESESEASTGSENELLRIKGAQLCLIDSKESVMIQSGDFSFNVIKQNQSPLAAVVGQVGDLQWPVGRDSPAMKVGSKKYAFALPGLLYGLLLPGDTPMEAEQSLEGLLQHYSAFEPHPEVSDGEAGWLMQVRQEAAEYWTAVAPQLEKISAKIVQKLHVAFAAAAFSATWTESGFSLMGPAAASSDGATDDNAPSPAPPVTAGSNDDSVSPRMVKRIQRARRLSAVAKLLSKTLLRGAINANRHVAGHLKDPSAAAQSSPSAADVTLASVEAFSKVVEAVETAGRSLFELSDFQEHHNNNLPHRCPDGLWTLNKSGLRLLLRATALSAVIHVARGIGTSGFSPAQSSPQSVLSQQPSDTPSEDNNNNNNCAINFMSADSVFSARAATRVQHRPNSPFQQYSKSGNNVDDSQFHFSLGLDTTNAERQA